MNRVDNTDELLSRLFPSDPLRPEQVARIRAGIEKPRPRAVPRLAIAAALCLVLCGFAAAAVYGISKARSPEMVPAPTIVDPPREPPAVPPTAHAASREAMLPQPPAPPIAEPVRTPPAHAWTPSRMPAPPVTEALARTPPAAASISARIDPPAAAASLPTGDGRDPVVRSPTAIPAAPADSASPPAPSAAIVRTEPSDVTLGAESLLIATSLHQLRKDHSPRAALDTLDRYASEFPQGALAREARATRVEALLTLGDRRAALALLDAMTVGTDLGVLRGELRLAAGRLDEAASDFTAAMIGARDDLEARALFGRAACRTRLRDRAGARQDLATYLERFPRGSQAAAARAALDEIDNDFRER